MRDLPQRYFVKDVPFWTGPKIYVMAKSMFDRIELDNFLLDFGFTRRPDQYDGTNGECVVEDGGRTCYLSYAPEVKGRAHGPYLENIRASGHGSVTRHATVTLKICGVSRGLTHELVRHAAGVAISQTSSRYVDARKLGFVVPPLLRDDDGLQRAFEKECLASLEHYETLRDHLALKGHHRKAARGAAREILPIGLAQMITFSFNVQSYRHVLRMRGSEHAEAQIRELAVLMAPIARRLWPNLCADVEAADGSVDLGSEI